MEFKKGDRVAIYSLQSFHGPGFYKGHKGTVRQDQFPGSSVTVIPDFHVTPGGTTSQDSYEVYPQQLRRLRKKRKPIVVEYDTEVFRWNGECAALKNSICPDLIPLIGKRVAVVVTEIL